MKIALLGGNGYQYAFAPSYARANGRGVIGQRELLGQTEAATGTMSDKDRRYGVFTELVGLGEKALDTFAGRTKPAATPEMETEARDNTALVVTGVVAGVAVLAVMLSGRKRKRR